MANETDTSRRLTAEVLRSDDIALSGLRMIVGYTPSNPDYSLPLVETAETDKRTKQNAERQAYAAWQAARDEAVAAEKHQHNLLLGAKTQVAAQFGESSNEYQSLGRKKKSEYKRTGGRKPTASPPAS